MAIPKNPLFLPTIYKLKKKLKMKKLFAILIIAGALVACDNSTKDKAAEGADSTQTANPTTDAKATDSAAMATDKMEAGKDSVKEGDKMMDKAADKMEAGKDSVNRRW